MKIILCMASYEDKKGMYYNTTVSLEYFDKDEVTKEVENYYKTINVEEFLLVDTWTDDSDDVNEMLLKNYSESFYSFLDFLEQLQENFSELKNINGELYAYINDNYFSGKGTVSEVLEFINENVIKYDSIDDIFEEKWEQDGNNTSSEFKSLFYWLSFDNRLEFLNKNIGTFEEFDGLYYEILN